MIALGLGASQAYGQKEAYSSEYWEDNWRDWPRPRFDYRIDSFAAVEHIIQREYFKAGSNSSGERYQQYARFQYPNQKSIDDWAKVFIQLPNYSFLKDIDFRIWEGDILVYEARSSALKEQYLDSVVVDPHTRKLFAFSLSFPDLKPGHIVEVMISLEGTPLPYHLGFHQSFPIVESVQRIKIVSAYPLRYSCSKGVSKEEDRQFENKFYRFNLNNCKALSPEQGLSTQAAELPGVWIDWLDQIFRYDREESQQWQDIIDHLFYEGELKDYAVYRNSLDSEFGLQQYYGSWIRPVRYFHQRPEYLASNEGHAEGRWRLSRAYAERWIGVQERLEEIIIDNKVPDVEEGLGVIYRAQKRASQRYIRQIPFYPPVFTEYGLLCSHYERFFKYHRLEYRLALFYPARSGEPDVEYSSPWPAYARGIAWRKGPNDNWSFIFPGPYLGQYLKPGQVPPDFQEGRALLFGREEVVPETVPLQDSDPSAHVVHFKRHIKLREGLGRAVIRDTTYYRGFMQSILASAYLRGDSAQDMLGFTNHQLLHNALLNDSLNIPRSKIINFEDTLTLILDLSAARTLRARPFQDRDFALPMVFTMQWTWEITSKDSLVIQLPLLPETENSIYRLKHRLSTIGDGRYQYALQIQLKECYIPKESLHFYQQLYDLVDQPFELKFWQKKLSTKPGM